MKRILVFLVAVFSLAALVLTGCQSSTPTSSAPASTTQPVPTSPVATTSTPPPTSTTPVVARTIKFSYTMPKGASIAVGFEWFGPAFEKATSGRYKVEIYPGATLVSVPAAYDSIVKGTVEMAYTSAGTFPKQFPLTLALGLPSLGFPGKTVKMYLAGDDAFSEFATTVPEIQNEFKAVILVQPIMLDPYNLVSKRTEIKAVADFKGLKVGGSGPKMEMVKAAGGASVNMVPPDSYMNLDKGIVDACFVTFGQVNDYKLQEIANFFSEQEFGSGLGIILMNKDFYNSMSAADQKILKDTWKAAMTVSSQGAMDSIEAGKKGVVAAGKKIYVSTPAEAAAWDAQADPSIASWRNDAKAVGISDATMDSILAKWKAIRTKYLAIGNAP